MSINTTTLNLGGAGEIEKFAMSNCLMIAAASAAAGARKSPADDKASLLFECKTCGRKFPSFQSLGGHRASHKKAKVLNSDEIAAGLSTEKKTKIHACSICGQEFHIGQALGGHMRRHRPITAGGSTVTTEGSTEKSDGNDVGGQKRKKVDDIVVEFLAARENTSYGKRVCLDLKLNGSENESEIEEGEIVEEKRDFLKLELRQPINNYNYC